MTQRQPIPAETMARRFRAQAEGCLRYGSPLYAALLTRAAADIEGHGPVWEVVAPFRADPGGTLLALRLMGATHRLALAGRAPALAAAYPSSGGNGNVEAAWSAWLELVSTRPTDVIPEVANVPQTNEVGRCRGLLGGFLLVAQRTGLPLRILEVGTSAGLNLRWDHFSYCAAGVSWGPPGSPVALGDAFVAGGPDLRPTTVAVTERRGCDLDPLDPTTTDGRLRLLSFVWPDQTERFANLAGACDLARRVPATVDQQSGDAWAADCLRQPTPGSATVIFHSVMLQYMAVESRQRLLDTIAAAGAAATEAAPLAWLRFEPQDNRLDADMEVRLTSWPGGDDVRLALSHPHGRWVRWLAEAA